MSDTAAARFSTLPQIPTTAEPRCVLCGGLQHRPFADGYDFELETCGNRWQFVECTGCTHVWLHPRPAVETLATIYPPSYYAYGFSTKLNPIAVRGKAWLDAARMRGIVAGLGRTPRSYLDIGCGDGRFLKAMREAGVKVNAGLELDEQVAAQLRTEGFDVYAERVEDCQRFSEGQFDLITMFHVIEHVADPVAVIAQLARWLAPGGVLALETPNLDSLDARMFKDHYWGGYHIPRHWHLFRPDTLKRTLTDAGLVPFRLRYQPGHSFWMYSWHHRLKYGARPWPRLARWFDPFNSLPVLVMTTALDKLRAAFGAKTSAMLVSSRKPG